MHLYAVASIVDLNSSSSSSSSSSRKTRTIVDKHNGLNPVWWSKMKLQVDKSELMLYDSSTFSIKFTIKSRRILGQDKKIGEVNLPLKDLYDLYSSSSSSDLDGAGFYKTAFSVSRLRSHGLENSGVLYLSFKFGSGGIYGFCQPLSSAAAPSAPYADESVRSSFCGSDYDSRTARCSFCGCGSDYDSRSVCSSFRGSDHDSRRSSFGGSGHDSRKVRFSFSGDSRTVYPSSDHDSRTVRPSFCGSDYDSRTVNYNCGSPAVTVHRYDEHGSRTVHSTCYLNGSLPSEPYLLDYDGSRSVNYCYSPLPSAPYMPEGEAIYS